MSCPQCWHENPPDAKFCNACGTRLEAACPACRHPNPAGSRFCSECGSALSGPPAAAVGPPGPGAAALRHLGGQAPAARALEGERKLVTVLFADVKGSMELLADRDPEDARKLLDPVLDCMMEAVRRYEGTVNQVMGDGIMALFGAPLAHEDHAARAGYAALRMQERMTRYGDEVQRAHGIPIQIRVGLNSGEVLVRSIGSDVAMDYTALGQTTHLAARMEQMAKPGSILLTAETLRLADGYLTVKPIGRVPVRGLAEPVEVFELVGAAAVRTRLQAAAARGLTRFVGRDAELDQLRRVLAQAGAGQGQVLAIVGEAGVGKSRLVWELTRSHHTHGWLVLEASCVSYGKNTAYLPVIDILKSYFEVEERDDARRTRAKLTGKLLTLDEELRPTLPAFQALLEVPVEDRAWQALDTAARRERTADAVTRLLLRESRLQPLLLVLEDLHWIDAQTHALLDELVQHLAGERILLLVNHRSEHRRDWGSGTPYTHVRLDPLPPETADGLLLTLVGNEGSLEPLKRQLVQLTQGNPFFIEESVRTLVETKVLVGEPGAYRLGTPRDTLQIPATVQAVLAARIDRLAPGDKQLLQSASVIGHEIPLPLLQAIAEMPEASVRAGLARLVAAEFLDEARVFPDTEYRFRHALTLEVAYASLVHARRRELHARVVAALEALHPERLGEQAARLAHHAFRGEVWDKALAYLGQTGRDVTFLSPDTVLGGPESPGTLWWTGEHERAVRIGERDLAIAGNFRNFTLFVVSTCRLGQAHHSLGAYDRAAEYFRRAMGSLQGDLIHEQCGMAGLPSVLARAWLAWCLAERGEFAEGIALGQEANELAETADHAYSRVLAAWGLGTLYLVRGDAARAVDALERGLMVARVADIPLLVPFVAAPLGGAYSLAGRGADGQALGEQALDQAAALNLRAIQPLWLTWLGEAHLLAGRPARAADLARQAIGLARQQRERGHEAYAHRLLADAAALDASGAESATAAYQDALGLAEELGMRPLAARCRMGLGCLRARTGPPEVARADLGEAAETLRALGMVHWLDPVRDALARTA